MADQPNVEVVENPKAGEGTDGPALAGWFKRILSKKLPKAKVTNVLDARQCRAFEHRMHLRGIDILILMSGDGGLQQWLTRTLPVLIKAGHKLPLIIIVRCGTQNVACNELGAVGPDIRRTLEGILDKIASGYELDVVHRHVLEIDGQYCLIVGALMVANLLERYYEGRKPGEPLGELKAAKVAAALMAEETRALILPRKRPSPFEPVPLTVRLHGVDGATRVQGLRDATGLVASTLTQIGLGLQPTYRALERHDAFHLIVTRGGFWSHAKDLQDFRKGRGSSSYVIDEIVREVEIDLDKERPYTIDGEWRQGRTLHMRLGPRLAFVRS